MILLHHLDPEVLEVDGWVFVIGWIFTIFSVLFSMASASDD